MKNVAIVAQGLSNGGAEKVASILANYLYEKGYNITYFCVYNDKKEYKLNTNIKIVNIYTNKNKKVTRLIDRNKQIYNELKKNNIDIVLSFIAHELLLSQFKGMQVIHSLRNDPQNIDKNFLKSKLRKVAYKKAKNVVFQTSGSMTFFSKKIQKKGVIIANPIETDDLPEWNSKVKSKTFITACRLTKQKNLSLMINSFNEFNSSNEYTLDIYGEGEEQKNLEELIKNLNATECIHLKGRSDKIFEIMQQSMAFVLSSNYEGLSNAMLEALCIGIPCICTDCPPGGAREFINSNNGILIPVGDKQKLISAFNKIANEKNKKKYLKENKNIREKLSKNTICLEWEKLLQ